MKIRKAIILPIIASLLLGFVMIGPVAAPSTTIGVEQAPGVDPTKVPGSTFTVEVWVRGVADLAGVEFKLGYNTMVLTATLIEYGGILGTGQYELVNDIYDADGYLHYGVMAGFGQPPFTGDGLAATITFSVDAVGESNLDLYDTKLGDPETPPNPIVHTAIGGYFKNTLEELAYSATLARRKAWPEKHDFYLWKEDEKRNDLFAIVENDGNVGAMVKVVFTVTDSAGIPVGDWETDTIPLEPGALFGDKKDARYLSPFPTTYPSIPPALGKYYVSAVCWVDTDVDNVPDTPMGSVKTFSFNIFP
jgi:hypothetical protein